jgi:alkylation response protein AidB-like acyl-CoA dehydrogenase
MMLFLDGGKQKTMRRKFIQSPTKNMTFLHKYSLNRPDSLTAHLELFNNIHDKYVTKMVPSRDDISYMTQSAAHTGTMANHMGLGVNTILNAGNDEQREEWLPAAIQSKMIVSYAQTELRHGSNVRGLSTTSEYIHEHNCFIINTPTLGSSKCWPGGLGATSTHAIVYANLLIPNSSTNSTKSTSTPQNASNTANDGAQNALSIPKIIEYGIHAFLVQVRDEEGKPLPGVIIGSNGDCIGDYGNDTGFLILTNVVVPKFNMLARFQWIDELGNYIKSEEKIQNPKLHYLTMLITRSGMIMKQSGILARGITIAMRYSFLRQQGFIHNGMIDVINSQLGENKFQEISPQVIDKDINKNIGHLIPQKNPATNFPLLSLFQQQIFHSNNPHSLHPTSSANLRIPTTVLPHLHRIRPLPLSLNPENKQLFKFQQHEYPLIEHSPQRSRLLRQLAMTYIFKSTGKFMGELFTQLNGGESMGSSDLHTDLLSDLAPMTAGLKATTTSLTHQGLLDLRETLGGNGYLKGTGIGQLFLDYAWEVTAEGERVPMLLQCGRNIIKGSFGSGIMEYLNNIVIPNLMHKTIDSPISSLITTSGVGNYPIKTTGGHVLMDDRKPGKINTIGQIEDTIGKKGKVEDEYLSLSPSLEYLKQYNKALIHNIQHNIHNYYSAPNSTIVSPLGDSNSNNNTPFIDNRPGETVLHHSDVPLPSCVDLYAFCFGEFSTLSSIPFTQTPPTPSNHSAPSLAHLNHITTPQTYLEAAKNTNSPYFLVYLLRLAQFKSLSLWSELLYQYCIQFEHLCNVIITGTGDGQYEKPENVLHKMPRKDDHKNNNEKNNTEKTNLNKNIYNEPNFLTRLYNNINFNTAEEEVIINSISQLIILSTQQHCITFMLSCFIEQILALHCINRFDVVNQQIALELLTKGNQSKDGKNISPFLTNLHAQIAQIQKDDKMMKKSDENNQNNQNNQNPNLLSKSDQFIKDYSTLIPVLTKLATFFITNEYLSDCVGLQYPHDRYSSPQKDVKNINDKKTKSSEKSISPRLSPQFSPKNFLQYSTLAQFNINASNLLIPDCIALCDSFDISDAVLASVVGMYDGNIYEGLFHNGLKAENNKSAPWCESGYNKVFANRLDVDMLVTGREEQEGLYGVVFGKKRDVNEVQHILKPILNGNNNKNEQRIKTNEAKL